MPSPEYPEYPEYYGYHGYHGYPEYHGNATSMSGLRSTNGLRVRASLTPTVCFACFLLLLTGCGNSTGNVPPVSKVSSSVTTLPTNKESMIAFTLSGEKSGRYTVQATSPTSKLRHGHREFTIDVEHAGASVFLVFYGYDGPGNYTLAQNVNGGDVHIALGKDMPTWDLSLQPAARCNLNIQSDTPTQSAGLDRMKGSFSCPLLSSSAPNHPSKPISVHDGSFDIAIIVES